MEGDCENNILSLCSVWFEIRVHSSSVWAALEYPRAVDEWPERYRIEHWEHNGGQGHIEEAWVIVVIEWYSERAIAIELLYYWDFEWVFEGNGGREGETDFWVQNLQEVKGHSLAGTWCHWT